MFVNDSLYDIAAYATKTAVQLDQFSSAQSLDRLGHRGYTRDESTEILFQPFQRDAIMSSSVTGRDVLSLTLPI